MTEPTQRQVDADIDKSIDLFKRADVGTATTITGRQPKRILVALDGSTQDYALVLFAQQLHQRLDCQIGYHDPETRPEAGKDTGKDTGKLLAEMEAERVELTTDLENNYDQILAASQQFRADLLMAPCPFGRDFQSLGEDSTGTVIDVLTARSKIPFIAIRRPDATGRDPTSHLRIILTGENTAAETAAQWAVGLARPDGRLELLLLVEESFYENFREALHAIKPDVHVSYEDLETALATSYARLHAGLQHAARSIGFTYELLIRSETDEKPITPEDPRSHPALVVLALERSNHDSQGEIHDFVRRSPHPVLVASVP